MEGWATYQGDGLGRPLVISGAVHGVLLVLLLVAFPQPQRGEPWGGAGGGAVQVKAVRSVPGVPLPRPPVVTQSRTATESRGFYEQRPRPQPPADSAVELPRFGEQRRARPPRQRRQEQERPRVLPQGAIPQGEGGPPDLPYTSFQMGAAEGSLSFGAGGSFGSRYPWYVDSVRRRISSNWLLSTVDPYVQWAPRAVISFEVLRDGTVVNTQVLRSSGVASVDRSALRAIRDSSPLDRLPSEYRGQRVLVEFWFDFRRPQ